MIKPYENIAIFRLNQLNPCNKPNVNLMSNCRNLYLTQTYIWMSHPTRPKEVRRRVSRRRRVRRRGRRRG